MTLHKILKYLALVIGVIGLILLGRIIATGNDALETDAGLQSSHIDPYMWVAYIVLFVVILLVAVFVLKGLFTGNIKNTLISLGAFALVVVVAYLLTDGVETELKDGGTLSASGAHWVSTGLVTFYILAAIAVGAMILSGVRKLIK